MRTLDKPKIIFLGTPEIAAYILRQLLDADYIPMLVVTKEDAPSGRGMKLQPSAVKQVAIDHGLALAQTNSLKKNPKVVEQMKLLQPDLLIVVAFGCILSLEVLNIPKEACVNVHASLLPKWRGAAPIQRALLAGDAVTGVTIMHLDEGIDTGDILLQKQVIIAQNETHISLYQKIKLAGAEALLEYLEKRHDITGHKQNALEVSYAEKLQKQDALIDFSLPASQIELHIRGFNPPGAFAYLEGVRYKIWEAKLFDDSTGINFVEYPFCPGTIVKADADGIIVQCGSNLVEPTYLMLLILQTPGRARQSYCDIIRNNNLVGKVFQN